MCAHHTSQSPQFDLTELVVPVCICIEVQCLQAAASVNESMIIHKPRIVKRKAQLYLRDGNALSRFLRAILNGS